MAVNCSVVPSATEAFVGVTEIELRVPLAPVPMRGTNSGLSFAESVKVKVPERVPVAVGLKVIEVRQFAPAANVFGLKGHAELI